MKKFFMLFVLIIFTDKIQSQNHEELIEGPFETLQEVTETCLGCHDGIGEEVLASRHWNWKTSDKSFFFRKALLYEFRVAPNSDLSASQFNHISFYSKENPDDVNNIDCLICHEQTGTYSKYTKKYDLLKVAQSVKKPTRRNCGTCHFDSQKGSDIRHGDLDKSLINPNKNTDVHMGGKKFNCTTCHTSKGHKISGADSKTVSCMNCHNDKTHKSPTLNKHIKNVACETCHIREFAKENATKIFVDWSKSKSEKGFEYNSATASRVKPQYLWFSGTNKYYSVGEKIDAKSTAVLVKPDAGISDVKAKIYPFKLVKGKIPFDETNNYLIPLKVNGNDGLGKTNKWDSSAEIGMQEMKLNYSGKVSFIEAESYLTVNHMVSPKEDALKCTQCHGVKGEKILNWKELGYSGDPMRTKGREKNKLVKTQLKK